jgi:predicted YcjX-like family ATPase
VIVFLCEFDYQLSAHFDHSFLFSLVPFLFGFARVRPLDLVVRLVREPQVVEVVRRLKMEEEVEEVVGEEASWNDDDLDVSCLDP